MKRLLIVIFCISFVSGCSTTVERQALTYSCIDLDQQVKISYSDKDVFYTWLKSGIGTTAFKTNAGKTYQLLPQRMGDRYCSSIES